MGKSLSVKARVSQRWGLYLILAILPALMAFRENPPRWTLDDFEFVWSTVRANYPYLELKGIDWEGVRQKYLADIDQVAGENMRGLILDLLGELRDGHVYLEVDGSRDFPFLPPRRRERHSFDPKNLGAHLGGCLRKARGGTGLLRKNGRKPWLHLFSMLLRDPAG